jgi:polysaccharide deacetylase family protein (PEP-CTERM system associated)
MINAMTIDLEDWFCVANLRHVISRSEWHQCELRVVDNTRRLLDGFARHEVEATFFVLGWVAERVPDLIREIADCGHEIATHGYSHSLLTEMTPESFEEDLQRAIQVTEACVDCDIVGFRAPSFTITSKTLWALDILARNGICYDSSIFPIGFHPDYGMPDAPLWIHKLTMAPLTEVPLSCAEVWGRRIPCSGGAYFRIFPYFVSKCLLRRCNNQGRPAIFYIHPWEIDPGQPRVRLPLLKRFRHYYKLQDTLRRLERLLNDFQFTSVRKLVGLTPVKRKSCELAARNGFASVEKNGGPVITSRNMVSSW